MKFELTESCTDETLTVDGVVITPSTDSKILKAYIAVLITKTPKNVLYGLLVEVLKYYMPAQAESLGHCETCGDYPYKYYLELE